MTNNITSESNVLIFQDLKRNWIVKVVGGKKFHMSDGHFDFDDIIGQPYGITVHTHLGTPLQIMKPIVLDYILKAPRKTNIIYPKDAGLILLHGGISSGCRIIESGAGSGALTTLLASIVRPEGHVYTYELRSDFIELTKRNLKRAGFDDNVTLYQRNIAEGADESDVDVVILDLGDPWTVIPAAHKALKPSGIFVSYSPTINQVMKTVQQLQDLPFCNIYTLECFVREIMVRTGKTRPATRMIGHTGYLTFARKLLARNLDEDA